MEYGAAYTSNSTLTNFSDQSSTGMEYEFMDELLYDQGRWLDSTGSGINLIQPSSSWIPRALNHIDPASNYIPSSESTNNSSHLIVNRHHHQIYQEDPTDHTSLQEIQSLIEGNELNGAKLWIGPRTYMGPCSSSMKERLMLAVGYLKEYYITKDRDVLVQIWVPIKKGGSQFLTTQEQPYFFNPKFKTLANYRKVSSDYLFVVEEDSREVIGLLGQAFLGKLPEWTPDVHLFRRDEYVQQYDVRGSVAVPVFERGDTTNCLGVVEIVMTTQMSSYRTEFEYVRQALEACDEFYQAALSEIVEVLTSVCKTHKLPLALKWAPCSQLGKSGCRHSPENHTSCVSTVDSACLISDPETLGFLEACSEHHLFRGQGIVGTAFATSKPSFAVDITAFSKTEYPLSHHARMFGLRASVAIPLRRIYTGLGHDFVLEFFLPKDCEDSEEQKRMLNSLSVVIQQSCRSLHIVMDQEEVGEQDEDQSLRKDHSSWVAHMMEEQKKGKAVSVSFEYQNEEPREEFKVTNWESNNGSVQEGLGGYGRVEQVSCGVKEGVEGGGDSYCYGGRRAGGGRKAGEKRRTKAEKMISLPVLRQYFTGSLKDAAKSIGVCPTTLKRICRQHGISRWPSRKIKKVGHSLRKLQLVINSVQGAEGSIQIVSFYKSFPQLSSSLNINDHQRQLLNHQAESNLFSHGAPSKSPTTSCSQTSDPRIYYSTNINTFPHAGSDTNLILDVQALNQEDPSVLRSSQSPPSFREHPNSREGDGFRVKATFGEEKVRFWLQPNWGFRDLQVEIAKRFNLEDVNNGIAVKYVDDDGEWVLLTCDADLGECREIYRSSKSHTIRVSLRWASSSHPN